MEIELESRSFEEVLLELEETVARLEEGNLTLEEALSFFERGQKLAKYCSKKLETASLRVEQLTADGEIVDLSDD